MQSSSFGLINDPAETLLDQRVPRSWVAFGIVMGYLIVRYFPYDGSWAPTSEWIITPLCNLHSKLVWGAMLIAEKIQNILNSPDVDREQLIAILGFLTEFIRWLRRLNFCFTFVLAHLDSINYWAFDTNHFNHELCVSTTRRLFNYYRTIERRLNIDRVDSALDG